MVKLGSQALLGAGDALKSHPLRRTENVPTFD
jgi:hypothetical protein